MPSRYQQSNCCKSPSRSGRHFRVQSRSGDQLKEQGEQYLMENYENITYAENGFDSSGHKVLIFTVFVTSKTDASKDEDDVEGDGPVPQHGRDQGKGETPEDAA